MFYRRLAVGRRRGRYEKIGRHTIAGLERFNTKRFIAAARPAIWGRGIHEVVTDLRQGEERDGCVLVPWTHRKDRL